KRNKNQQDKYPKWRNILWTDESKIVLFESKSRRQFGRQPPNTEAWWCITIWGCFSYYGVGLIYRTPGIMDQFAYAKILEEVMLPSAEKEIPLKWVFQHDSDPKHTTKLTFDEHCPDTQGSNRARDKGKADIKPSVQVEHSAEDKVVALQGQIDLHC
uniref:Tc1-like transposase DDE domain-containing protein n=1 Tax=Echeneis naucrates TaxID=173247 RepID=A0A665UD56_ECHNA